MKIHEYQGKALLRKFGVPLPNGDKAQSVDEADQVARRLIEEGGNEVVVVKSQIHAGGRGKGRFKEDPELGGVKVCRGADAAKEVAGQMLGKTLVTHQTGPEGKKVGTLLIESGIDIARELYLGMVVDRAQGRVVIMASAEGGTEIEEVAAKSPEKILREAIDPALGYLPYIGRKLAYGLGLAGNAAKGFEKLVRKLSSAFVELDCSLAEINPLVVTGDGNVLALDAKMNFDDNALFRHADIEALRDRTEEDESELEGKRLGISYVKLDGNIGCMVNGAGLAMSTMDIIKKAGGEPANFLDVGGSASAETVAAAFKIITSDPNVKGIFINIFGGIMKCDVLADGVVTAVKEVGLKVPLVVRLEGTNVDRGREILAQSGLNLVTAADMADGAKQIVELVK